MFHQAMDNQNSLLGAHSYRLEDLSSDSNKNATTVLGRPSKKRTLAYVDVVVIAISVTCLILAYLTITPRLPIAWRLEYSGQIVVIGFLLSIMNVCMTTILSYTNLLLEARFGPSRLQNYEAILTSKTLKSHVSVTWRSVLVLLTILPIGLSVAYKRFLHGVGTTSIPSDPDGLYGVDLPQVSDYAPADDPIYTFITSINPFQAAWTRESYPEDSDFPVAYGYNTLLLSNTSAAILDVPTLEYVKNMQDSMKVDEAWNVSADVSAYFATYNSSTPTLRKDDMFWVAAFNTTYNYGKPFMDMNMYHYSNRIGSLHVGNGSQMFFGLYNATDPYDSNDMDYISDYTDPDIVAFRVRANLYQVQRIACHGNWYINKTSINLISGNCDPSVLVRQDVVTENYPYHMDTMPIFGHLFLTAVQTYQWPWLNATYAISVATSYWARAVYMLNPRQYSADGNRPSEYYPPQSERIISSRATLNANIYLYLVLAIQPLMTVIAFIASLLLRDIPIERGFGVTALSSGFDLSSARLIDGAALSGELKKPVRLEIRPMLPDQELNMFDSTPNYDARIKYRLTSGFRPTDRPKLQTDRIYW